MRNNYPHDTGLSRCVCRLTRGRSAHADRHTQALVLACGVYVLGGAVVLAAASWAAKHVV
jgi:hypothetical protein